MQPEGWAKPQGYSNGVVARGRKIALASQIGWNAQSQFDSDDLIEQVAPTLRNIAAVLACDGASPEHIVNR